MITMSVNRRDVSDSARLRRTLRFVGVGLGLFVLPLLTFTGCSGGSGGSGGANRFELVSTNGLENNSVWQLNRAVELTFTQPVDIATANLNSVQIYTVVGTQPALGTFFLKAGSDGKTLVFQPICPTNTALDNGGFHPGPTGGQGIRYRVSLPTAASRSNTLLQSTVGDKLTLGGTREFVTPSSPPEYFLDPKPNSPPRLTSITLGVDQIFPDPNTGGPPQQAIPLGLNTFTNPIPALVLTFDQPLFPTGGNVSSRTMQLLYEPTVGTQVTLPATVTLIENCSETGSRVMISPQGILPPGAELTLLIKRELQDLVGERNLADQVPVRFSVESTPTQQLDQFKESFDSSTFEDENAVFAEPRAEWSDTGVLAPATAFEGTNPDFDWDVGTTISIDTDFDTITNAAGTQTIPVVNGVIDVNDVFISANGRILASGSNPLTILATGSVTIQGDIFVDGTTSNGTNTLCTAFIPETGAPGQCGGGKGGDGSWETTTSTPRGGNGNGSYNDPLSGGQGGESGYGGRGRALENQHRPGGGGGGSLGTLGQAGANGHAQSFGAESAQSPPRGGNPGPSPFVDGNASNNFFGIRVNASTGEVIFGELPIPFGGQGGGAGGDGIQWTTFPNPAWNDPSPSQASCDMKGGGGGGGAGILIIKALGAINITGAELSADGGNGGGGETAPGIGNRVAGGSGAGSGGHIIIMSGTSINATGANVHARGGRGGIGQSGGQYPTTSAGAPGGDGIIQYHVPNPSVNLTPANPPGTPTPYVLVPDFGSLSTAQTKWVSTGFSDPGSGQLHDGPLYIFPGLLNTMGQVIHVGVDPLTGLVERTANNEVRHPNVYATVRVPQGNFGGGSTPNRVVIPGEIDMVPNPAILVGWDIRDQNAGSSAPFFTVTAASVVNGDTVLDVDRFDMPFIPGTVNRETLVEQFSFAAGEAIVGFYPRFYSIDTDGVENDYPQSVTVQFTFQGANRDATDPSQPDLTTLVPDPMDPTAFTGNITDLVGKEFFRVRIQFNVAANGAQVRYDSPRPTLNYFTLPFNF
ncbi:MAG: hypothetical protein H6834_17475 [Planctomycetes bacterium]|nr:hypothetical protein [Planctomycetota bacterium]